jgi:glycosyltransferase involved in cell wall biosynthesis
MSSKQSGSPSAWLLVNLGFTPNGGQDLANFELAKRLAEEGAELTLVAHDVSEELRSRPNVSVIEVPRPIRSNLLGERLLDREGARAFRSHPRRGELYFLGNGGSCPSAQITWVHYVHHAWSPNLLEGAAPLRTIVSTLRARDARSRERRAFSAASLVITNSDRTSKDVASIGIEPTKVRRVYLGADTLRTHQTRRTGGDERTIVFIGALGWEVRKGLDTALRSLAVMTREQGIAHRMIVAGNGNLAPWQRLAGALGLEKQVDFVGFVNSSVLLQQADLLVAPVRYEPYGLGIQEALCAGVPVLVSSAAGITERFTPAAERMVVPLDAGPDEWARRTLEALHALGEFREIANGMRAMFARRSWSDFADDLIATIRTLRPDPTTRAKHF